MQVPGFCPLKTETARFPIGFQFVLNTLVAHLLMGRNRTKNLHTDLPTLNNCYTLMIVAVNLKSVSEINVNGEVLSSLY